MIKQILKIILLIFVLSIFLFSSGWFKRLLKKDFQEKPPAMYMPKDAVRMIDTLESKDGTKKIKVEYLKENGKWVPNRLIPESEWEE